MVQDKGPNQINRDEPPEEPMDFNEDDDISEEGLLCFLVLV